MKVWELIQWLREQPQMAEVEVARSGPTPFESIYEPFNPEIHVHIYKRNSDQVIEFGK